MSVITFFTSPLFLSFLLFNEKSSLSTQKAIYYDIFKRLVSSSFSFFQTCLFLIFVSFPHCLSFIYIYIMKILFLCFSSQPLSSLFLLLFFFFLFYSIKKKFFVKLLSDACVIYNFYHKYFSFFFLHSI